MRPAPTISPLTAATAPSQQPESSGNAGSSRRSDAAIFTAPNTSRRRRQRQIQVSLPFGRDCGRRKATRERARRHSSIVGRRVVGPK